MANVAPCPQSNGLISGCSFTNFLVDEQPRFDELILEDIRPEDDWLLHIPQGVYESFDGVQKFLDRFNHVWPNVTKQWTNTAYGNCLGTPCDKKEHYITWGSTRTIYFLEEQSWASPLVCYESDMHVTHAMEQYQQIIRDILKPATAAIMSNYARKRVAQNCQQQYVANSSFSASTNNFSYTWVVVGDEEIYIDTNTPASNVYKLTPQMLQRRVDPLQRWGYFGKNPYKDSLPYIELVTDEETKWDLDRLGGQQGIGGVPSITGNWRFESWDSDTVKEYWRYNFSGTLGNYSIRVDPLQLRFNSVGPSPLNPALWRYQVVLPFINVPSSGAGQAPGTKDVPNPAYDFAQYAWSITWHRKAGSILVAEARPMNPEMPFAERNFAGRWQFVMDNLGADINGQPIENKRRNKGQFIGDFKHAYRAEYNELSELYFHKREPACVIQIQTCNADPGYPAQNYESDPVSCAGTPIVD